MWNERYRQPGYLFGTEPAQFLRNHADFLKKDARTLAVADGEGRNSTWLAEKGLDVTAFDASEVAVEKARALAARKGVKVNHHVLPVQEWQWRPEQFDLVVAIFIQFADPALRSSIFAGMKKTLRPGGLLLLHGYTPEQLDYGTGGPPTREPLYTVPLLEKAFADMEMIELKAHHSEIEEGPGHSGMSALVDLVARKPAL